MKTLLISLLVLISATNFKSCGNNKKSDAKVKDIIIDENMVVSPPKDETIRLNVKMLKNFIMELTVEYNGCEDDEFDLLFNNMWLKSMPPKANLFLIKNESNCKSKKNYTKTYLFDVSKLKYSSSKTVMIRIKNYTEYFKFSYDQ